MKTAKLGSGKRFSKLSSSVAKGYKKKDMSSDKAEDIGDAVAAKRGMEKYGKKKMMKMAVAGKKRKSK